MLTWTAATVAPGGIVDGVGGTGGWFGTGGGGPFGGGPGGGGPGGGGPPAHGPPPPPVGADVIPSLDCCFKTEI